MDNSRDNIPDCKDTDVCDKYWHQDYPTIIDYGKLRPGDPPLALTLNQAYLPLFLLPQDKLLELMVKYFQSRWATFQQQGVILYIENIKKKSSLLILTILVLLCDCNWTLNQPLSS